MATESITDASQLTPHVHARGGPYLLERFEADLRVAARRRTSVLISAARDIAVDVARQIARRGPVAGTLDVLDCDGAPPQVVHQLLAARLNTPAAAGRRILLLREIHALAPETQTMLANWLDGEASARSALQIVASSSVGLFSRVRAVAFDARLFYRLNTIHISIGARRNGYRVQ